MSEVDGSKTPSVVQETKSEVNLISLN